MGKAKPFLFGSLLGASTMFVALQYHVVRSHDGLQLVPRTPQHSLGLAYADIRQWNAEQWTDRTELARALMAHGAGDLIAQSVADTLADSVSADSATLDQLRSFFNKPATDESAQDAGLFRLPDLQPLQPDAQQPGDGGDAEPFSLPIPREARKPPEADPFRVAQSPAGPADPAPLGGSAPGTRSSAAGLSGESASGAQPGSGARSTAQGSRFSASDILNSNDSVFQETRTPPASAGFGGGALPGQAGGASLANGPQPSGGTQRPGQTPQSTTRQYADAVEQAIFGQSPGNSGTGAAGTGSASAGGTFSTSGSSARPAGTAEAGPFGDISSDLESRARSALSRAQSTLTDQAGQAVNQRASAASQYVRDRLDSYATQAQGLTAGQANGGTGGAAASAVDAGLQSLSEKFDPFIE